METSRRDPIAANRDQLRAILGPGLSRFADLIPVAMAYELLRDEQGFIARYQLDEALLSQLRPEMCDWSTPAALRALAPSSPLARNRMQAIAGALAPISCRAFPAFSYYPYIPFAHVAAKRVEAPLIVAVHGSSRNPKDLRDAYAAFAERYGCFVLAPLFPLQLEASVPDEEYKQLIGDTVRYDRLLWAMIDELEKITATRFSRILLFGFSGGAQFAQRLLYVDPARLSAVSLAAPSYVTLPDPSSAWWMGVGDFEQRFDKLLDLEAMRRVPIQLLCGSKDDLDCNIYSPDELDLNADGYAAYGRSRPQRLSTLRDAYAGIGIETNITIVEGAGHEFRPLLETSMPFFESLLRNEKDETARRL